MIDLEKLIRDVPDFPKPGIVFKDITPLLASCEGLGEASCRLAEPFAQSGVEIVAAIEARGFIFGSLVAQRLGAGFVPIRKPGKLPAKVVRLTYDLEYGSDTIEMHADAIAPGQKVLLIDDVLATGGTMAAACKLVEQIAGKVVAAAFVVELDFLHGRDKLAGRNVHSLIRVK